MRVFPACLKLVKKVSSFLHLRSNRDVLLASARTVVPEAGKLERWSHSFAKWRWGTLVTLLEALVNVMAPLRASFRPDDFPKEDRTEFRLVVEAILSDRFWRYCKLVLLVTKETELLRSWCNGCACHEEQLKQHTKISCWMKSRRLPDLVDRLQRSYQTWTECLATFQFDGDHQAIVDGSWLSRSFIGQLQLKTACLRLLPYVLVWVDRPEVAEQCLRDYERLRVVPAPPHPSCLPQVLGARLPLSSR